jgi:hypothetical protein
MAPILSYLRIHPRLSIPLRITINLQHQHQQHPKQQQQHFFQSAINVQNNTRLVTFLKTQKVYLSNTQVRELVAVFQKDIVALLVSDSIDVIRLKSSSSNSSSNDRASKDTLSVVLSDARTGWRIRLVFTVQWLEGLRNGAVAAQFGDLIVRVPSGEDKDDGDNNTTMQILQEEQEELRIPPEEGTAPEEVHVVDDDVEEVKFKQRYNYKRHRVYHSPLKIEVIAIKR